MPVSLGILCTQQLYPLALHCAALATPGLFMRSIAVKPTSLQILCMYLGMPAYQGPLHSSMLLGQCMCYAMPYGVHNN